VAVRIVVYYDGQSEVNEETHVVDIIAMMNNEINKNARDFWCDETVVSSRA
jgi:hypothetical protein